MVEVARGSTGPGGHREEALLDEVAAAMAPPRSHARFPLFDSLRAVAAIAILVVHVAIFTGGYSDTWHGRLVAHLDIGVAFFFLLSAFLLYRPFVAARRRHADRPAFSGYARRRFLRIAPGYWAVLTIAAIVPGMAGAFSGNWWVYYGLLQNYPVFTPEGTCAVDPYRCAIPPAWSLSLEVFFYALLPFFVIGMASLAKLWRGRSWLVPEIAVLALISVASLAIQSRVPITDLETVLFYSPVGRGWWFALGLGLAALSVWAQERDREPRAVALVTAHPWVPWLGALAVYLWLAWVVMDPAPSSAFPLGDLGQYRIQYVAFGVIALLVVLPATFGSHRRDPVRRLLAHPILTWLGLISYGIFLWQFPVLIALFDAGVPGWWPARQFPLVAVMTLAGTIACAAISFYALERPLMRWGKRRFGSAAPERATPEAAP